MDLNLASMASMIGVSISVIRFLLCFVATIPVSFIWRHIPGGPFGKNLYAAFTGVILSYLSFGLSSNLHFLVLMAVGYVSMVLYRERCGLVTFVLAMAYLIGCHVFYMSGDAWKEGAIDATGALMVLTLKVISCAINYNDGILKEEDLREAQKKNRLLSLPSLHEYFGYCLCCGSHFAGPVFEIKDYLEWTEKKGIWTPSDKGRSPSPYGPALRAILQAALCMGVYLYLVPLFPLIRFTEPVYQKSGFWKRMGYQYMVGFTTYTLEILLYMVNIGMFYHYLWSGI